VQLLGVWCGRVCATLCWTCCCCGQNDLDLLLLLLLLALLLLAWLLRLWGFVLSHPRWQ
jgi:hypothetical protein